MFKITIITLGKYKEDAYFELEKLYVKRLKSFVKLNIIEIPEVPYKSPDQMDSARREEAEKIISAIPASSIVILLDERGMQKSSVDFANFINRIGSFGEDITFVIGSGAGLHETMKQYSNYQISLSSLTFPHNMARMLLMEQLYRAITIIKKIDYHK